MNSHSHEPSNQRHLIKGAHVWLRENLLEKVDLGIENGKIIEIGELNPRNYQQVEVLEGLIVLPGVIDTQVHFREPGRTHKEDLETGSKAALLGGVTGFFEMPNTSPATTTLGLLEDKLRMANNRCYVDYAFYAGATRNNNLELQSMIKNPGCCGIKIFMGSSTGDLLVHEQVDLERIFSHLPGPFAIHAEDEERLLQQKKVVDFKQGAMAHELWRDEQAAFLATQRAVSLAEKFQKWAHILHVSTQAEAEFLTKHKKYCTLEVTPQHLTLESPECYEKLGTRAQMNPPIRGRRHREALWKALRDGVVDLIGSDHAPHTLQEKSHPVEQSPAGMPGVQTLLPIMLDHVHRGNLSLQRLVELVCLNPAKLFRLKDRGPLAVGSVANLTVVDLKREVTLSDSLMASRVGWTPFNGMKVKGFPVMVYLRGKCLMREGEIVSPPQGRPLEKIRV